MKNTRVVFMGSPAFSLPSLKAIFERYTLVGAVTQPDRPSGRGRLLTPPPVKTLAQELGVPVIQPRRLSEPFAQEKLLEWHPDLIIVAAFGQILKSDVLNMPENGCINVHASLLPRWRGAAPIPAAIGSGDLMTGVTIMRMDAGIDTGPMLAQKSEPIFPDDTAESLSARLARLGADLLIETLPGYMMGEIVPQAQENTLATYAPMLKKEDGLLDFQQSAYSLALKIRAYLPWPGTYFTWQGQSLKVLQARSIALPEPELSPWIAGKFIRYQGFPAVITGEGILVFEKVQPPGKRAMTGHDFLLGAKNWDQL